MFNDFKSSPHGDAGELVLGTLNREPGSFLNAPARASNREAVAVLDDVARLLQVLGKHGRAAARCFCEGGQLRRAHSLGYGFSASYCG